MIRNLILIFWKKYQERYRNYIIIKIVIFICPSRKKQINIITNVRKIRL